MKRRDLGFGLAGLLLAVLAACGGGSDKPSIVLEDRQTAAPPASAPAKVSAPPATLAGGDAGPRTQAPRLAVDEHCCSSGAYFVCPGPQACFGDAPPPKQSLSDCLGACDPEEPDCFRACLEAGEEHTMPTGLDELDEEGAPAGCRKAEPPPGIDCVRGIIDRKKS